MKNKIIYFSIYLIIFTFFVLLIPKQFKILVLILGLILMPLIIYLLFFKKKEIKKDKKIEHKNIVKVIPKNLPDDFDFKAFEKEVKDLYINIQEAFMNYNYEYLESHLSKTLYSQYKKQMDSLKLNDRVAIRSNINYIDFIFNEFNDNKFIVSIGVYEDKYTKKVNEKDKLTGVTYESYYELIIIKKDYLILDNLKLVYSHSKKS